MPRQRQYGVNDGIYIQRCSTFSNPNCLVSALLIAITWSEWGGQTALDALLELGCPNHLASAITRRAQSSLWNGGGSSERGRRGVRESRKRAKKEDKCTGEERERMSMKREESR